jgi:hypothetical protein
VALCLSRWQRSILSAENGMFTYPYCRLSLSSGKMAAVIKVVYTSVHSILETSVSSKRSVRTGAVAANWNIAWILSCFTNTREKLGAFVHITAIFMAWSSVFIA